MRSGRNGAVGLPGKEQARPDGQAVEPDGAGTADYVLAADVRAAEPEIVAEKVREEAAVGDAAKRHGLSVDGAPPRSGCLFAG